MKSEKINVNVSIQTMFDLPGGKIKSALSSLPFLRASLEEFWKCKPFLFLFGRCDFLKNCLSLLDFDSMGTWRGTLQCGQGGRLHPCLCHLSA